MFLYLFNVFAEQILNENVYITLKNKHVALSHGKKVVTASPKAIKSSSAYSDKIKIEYNEGKYSIEIGHRYLCSGKDTNTLNVCKTLTNDNAVSIVKINECYKILNNQKSCATNYTNGLFFEKCTDSSDQCFDIVRVENDPENSIKVPKEKFNESRRGIKPIKDYDMKYVIDAIDEAHHEIAEEDSSWIIKDKHFVPECFYGYKTVFSFLTDPLPNLTKLKQKYCMYNQMVNESLV